MFGIIFITALVTYWITAMAFYLTSLASCYKFQMNWIQKRDWLTEQKAHPWRFVYCALVNPAITWFVQAKMLKQRLPFPYE